MINKMFRIKELKEAIKESMEVEQRPQCEYCEKYFGSDKTLEIHQDGLCLEKIYAEDPYAYPGDPEDIEKGIAEVEGWTTISGRVAEKLGGKCSFCFKELDLEDKPTLVSFKEDTEEIFHNWCAKEQQRIDGDREV